MQATSARAWPRAGLLGNPSDGFGGRVLAFTFDAFRAEVDFEPGDYAEVASEEAVLVRAPSFGDLFGALRTPALAGMAALAVAAVRQLAGHPQACDRASELRGRFTCRTTIPRQAGLAGSSALVVAVLRALSVASNVRLSSFDLAELALRAETESLGIAAGPQDRVAQAYEGLLAMDFREPRRDASYVRLDPRLLPPLLIAWAPEPGQESGQVHASVKTRFERGDQEVQRVMREIAELARRGQSCLESGDVRELCLLVDRNFDLRASIYDIAATDRRMIALGRELGAATKLCGSGGSVLVVPREPGDLSTLSEAYENGGYRVLRPQVAGPRGFDV